MRSSRRRPAGLRPPSTFGLRPLADRQRGRGRLAFPTWAPCAPFAAPRAATTRTGETSMTTMAVNTPRSEGMTSEQRLVIFASSLGTVFEWYDFYIYGTLGAFLAKVLLLERAGECRLHLRAAHVCRRLCGPPFRRADLRPFRRLDRPQIHLPGDDVADGRRHILYRRTPRLRFLGHHGAGGADWASPRTGPCSRR